MDILAHALWAGVGAQLLRRHQRLSVGGGAALVALAVMPDIPQLLPIVGWAMSGHGSIELLYDYAFAEPGTEPWLPPIVQTITHHLHCAPHSAIVAACVTALTAFLRRAWLLPLLGWWSHIVIDVFTHSKDYYAVPVLYPITDVGFDGIAWIEPRFLLLNYLALAAVYAGLFFWRQRGPRPVAGARFK